MFGDRMLRQETLKPKSVGATLARFSRYFRPYWFGLTLVTVLMAVNAYTQVIGPVLIGQAVDCFLAPPPSAKPADRAEVFNSRHRASRRRKPTARPTAGMLRRSPWAIPAAMTCCAASSTSRWSLPPTIWSDPSPAV